MPRISRGCLPCRTRKVKCDQGKPVCERCLKRGELCDGYRDDWTLNFRDETSKVATPSLRRHRSVQSLSAPSQIGNPTGTFNKPLPDKVIAKLKTRNDSEQQARGDTPTTHLAAYTPPINTLKQSHTISASNPYPWLKIVPSSQLSPENHRIAKYFSDFVIYPGTDGSTPGFIEHLPSMFEEGCVENRCALRWAVKAAAYMNQTSSGSDLQSVEQRVTALHCYGKAMAELARSLSLPQEHGSDDMKDKAPDDYVLMTVVVLDLFESLYLSNPISNGDHAEGMKQILRLRGREQLYTARGWSLFRLSHHRLQQKQLAFHQDSMPESVDWLETLNEDIPHIRIEKHAHEITKTCARARQLMSTLNTSSLDNNRIPNIIEEMYHLDEICASWRLDPNWAYKTLHRSSVTQNFQLLNQLPDYIELHRDIWLAYEWNYHRTARIILHEHLLRCLDSVHTTNYTLASERAQASTSVIIELADQILATVPQSLGDVSAQGGLTDIAFSDSKCSAIGGYFLLWPMRVLKVLPSLTPSKRESAEQVFQRIRKCTGMKHELGELSNI